MLPVAVIFALAATGARASETVTDTSATPKYAGKWKQCGGLGFKGPYECVSGWSCAVTNEWYSQCEPAETTPPKSPGGSSTGDSGSGTGGCDTGDCKIENDATEISAVPSTDSGDSATCARRLYQTTMISFVRAILPAYFAAVATAERACPGSVCAWIAQDIEDFADEQAAAFAKEWVSKGATCGCTLPEAEIAVSVADELVAAHTAAVESVKACSGKTLATAEKLASAVPEAKQREFAAVLNDFWTASETCSGRNVSPSPNVPPAGAYKQCGGKGWTGATTCAAGLRCSNIVNGEENLYFSQCVPDESAVPIVKPDPVLLYQQCGGEGYTGNTVCAHGLVCKRDTKYYSFCAEDPSKVGEQEPIAELYGQCGGLTWEGAVKCQFGAKCTVVNVNYSQCTPDEEGGMDITERVPIYKQCGGGNYKGPTLCEHGLMCSRIDAYYSQCIKDPSATEPAGPVQAYEQCGGVAYSGPTQCERGYVCKGDSIHFKQCVPEEKDESVPELPPAKVWKQCGGKDHKGPFECEYGLKCTVKSEYFSICEPDAAFLEQEPVEAHAQCGGKGYSGSTRCVDGYVCTKTNAYWSACTKPGEAAPGPK